MGIGVKRFVTYHGLALNVGHDVSLFDLITLCGIGGAKATSMSAEADGRLNPPLQSGSEGCPRQRIPRPLCAFRPGCG